MPCHATLHYCDFQKPSITFVCPYSDLDELLLRPTKIF